MQIPPRSQPPPPSPPSSARDRDGRPQPRVHNTPDIRGKHRQQAELNRLNQEIRTLQEELEKLDNTELSSVVCKELVTQITSKQDPLITRANADQSVNRWFEQPAPTRGCCWRF